MTIIDRYMLKSFFFNLTLWCFCIVGVYVVFDLFTNLDTLLSVGKEAGSVPKTLLTYYTFKAVPIVMSLSSILGLTSAMITISMMMRHNEVIPLQAAGISTMRIVAPLIGAAVVVSALSVFCRECVLPNYIDELAMEARDFNKKQGIRVNASRDKQTGLMIQGNALYRSERRISEPIFTFQKPVVKQNTQIKAENAIYRPATKTTPAGYLLSGSDRRSAILSETPLLFEGKTLLLAHKDAPDWIGEEECFVATDIPFDYMASTTEWREYASTLELIRAARSKSLDVGDRIRSTIHGRLLQPLLDMTLLLIGLPIIISCGERVFRSVGLSGLVIALFLIVCQASTYLGGYMGMPVLGAWFPLLLFGPVAVYQFAGLYGEI